MKLLRKHTVINFPVNGINAWWRNTISKAVDAENNSIAFVKYLIMSAGIKEDLFVWDEIRDHIEAYGKMISYVKTKRQPKELVKANDPENNTLGVSQKKNWEYNWDYRRTSVMTMTNEVNEN